MQSFKKHRDSHKNAISNLLKNQFNYSQVSANQTLFSQGPGLDRLKSQGHVNVKLVQKEESRSEFTPFVKNLSPSEKKGNDFSNSGKFHGQKFKADNVQNISGSSASLGCFDSCDEMDPLARCLYQMEQDLDNGSQESFVAQGLREPVASQEFCDKKFRTNNQFDNYQPVVMKSTLLDACFQAIDSDLDETPQIKQKNNLKVEYLNANSQHYQSKCARNVAMVSVEESMRRKQDIFGLICQLRQPDLREEYVQRTLNPQNYDSDSSISEQEEFEIDSRSAPSLSLTRQPCGYFKKYDVSYTML